MAAEGGVNGAWKWLAAILASILLTGLPGMVYALRTWTVASHVERIQERQDDVRIRLTVLEEQHRALTAEISKLRDELEAHVVIDRQ